METPFEESWFFAGLERAGDRAMLAEEEAIHLRKVLRVRLGRPILVTNGSGKVFLCDTADLGGKVEVTALEAVRMQPDPPKANLVLGLLKGRDIEDPVEGLCQLPLAAIHLVLTDHTQEFKGQEHGRLVERLKQKSLVGAKQAKKPWLTAIHSPLPLDAWRSAHPGPLILVHPGPDRLERVERESRNPYYVLIGPEGGFSKMEVDRLAGEVEVGFLGLGETRIRAVHAPLVACGKLMGLGYL